MRRVRARLAREGLPLRRPLQPLLALDEPDVPNPPAAPRPPPEPRDRQPQVAGAVAEARDAMGANDLLSDAAIKE
jgi:hypothetical protein